MSEELISKEALRIAVLDTNWNDDTDTDVALDMIDGLQTVEERKHGRWIDYPHGSGSHCSYCDLKIRYKDKNRFKLCPNCGAIMDEVSKNE